MKIRIQNTINWLKENYKIFANSIERVLDQDGESLNNYIVKAIEVFDEYDQGSLSFTETKLKQIGYNYPYAILEAIESCK